MIIRFADEALKKVLTNKKKAIRKYTREVIDTLYRRLGDLASASCIDDIRKLPGGYHQLRNNRSGQWACNLSAKLRLVFTIEEDDTVIVIIEITNYHNNK